MPDIKVEVSDIESAEDSSSNESDSIFDELDSDDEIMAKTKRNKAQAEIKLKREEER